LIRLDSDQHARRTVQKNLRIVDPDYYRFETHVLFDDAFEGDENGNRVPNRYVKQLVAAVNVAGAYVDYYFHEKVKNLIKTTSDMFMVWKRLLKIQLKFPHHMVDVWFGYYQGRIV
jgi:hypothetical protein